MTTTIPTTHFLSDKRPSLEEAQKLVGGYVQMITLTNGSQMLVDEDGISKNLPFNLYASVQAGDYAPIYGDVLILSGVARWVSREVDIWPHQI